MVPAIVEMRDGQRLTFDDIGLLVGSSGEGARRAYLRAKGKRPSPYAPEPSEDGRATPLEGALAATVDSIPSPDAEGRGASKGEAS